LFIGIGISSAFSIDNKSKKFGSINFDYFGCKNKMDSKICDFYGIVFQFLTKKQILFIN